jgi:hypothetical protein
VISRIGGGGGSPALRPDIANVPAASIAARRMRPDLRRRLAWSTAAETSRPVHGCTRRSRRLAESVARTHPGSTTKSVGSSRAACELSSMACPHEKESFLDEIVRVGWCATLSISSRKKKSTDTAGGWHLSMGDDRGGELVFPRFPTASGIHAGTTGRVLPGTNYRRGRNWPGPPSTPARSRALSQPDAHVGAGGEGVSRRLRVARASRRCSHGPLREAKWRPADPRAVEQATRDK